MVFPQHNRSLYALISVVLISLLISISCCLLPVSASSAEEDIDIQGPYFEPSMEAENRSVSLDPEEGKPEKAKINFSLDAVGREALTTAPHEVVFVADWSASMDIIDPNFLRSTAVKNYIDDMDNDDRGAVVKFSVEADLKAPLTEKHHRLKWAISEDDESGRGTNFEDAISTSTDELIENGNPNKQWVQIILTDGRPTKNVTMDTMKKVWNNHISIYTIGLGDEMDESMLRWLANSTGGVYHHVPTAEGLLGTYLNISDQVHSSLAGRNITVRMDFNKHVDVDLNGFSKRPSHVKFGDEGVSLVWNLSQVMKLEDRWEVSFPLTVTKYGWVSLLKKDSGIYYVRPWDNKNNYTSIPQFSVYGIVDGSAPPPPPPTSSAPPPPPVDTFPVPSSSLGVVSTSPQTQPVSLFVAVFVALGIGEAVKSRMKISEKRAIKMHSGQEPLEQKKQDQKTTLGYTCNER